MTHSRFADGFCFRPARPLDHCELRIIRVRWIVEVLGYRFNTYSIFYIFLLDNDCRSDSMPANSELCRFKFRPAKKLSIDLL